MIDLSNVQTCFTGTVLLLAADALLILNSETWNTNQTLFLKVVLVIGAFFIFFLVTVALTISKIAHFAETAFSNLICAF